jgi:16S rRNA (guanine527-N7)-methyltransferase
VKREHRAAEGSLERDGLPGPVLFLPFVKEDLMVDIRERFLDHVKNLGWELSPGQLEQFDRYMKLLVSRNRSVNLTALTEERDVYIKHFFDSLTVVKQVPMDKVEALIDVGTGAGFPGLPLKILFPDLRVVLLDSLRKRVDFLKDVIRELELDRTEAIHGRAEEIAREKEYRERFDVAVARAVARLPVLAEFCLPFVRVGGWFVAMKGPEAEKELEEAGGALQKLGGGEVHQEALSLPEGMGERRLLSLRKQSPTPSAYPRRPGIPVKNPLR